MIDGGNFVTDFVDEPAVVGDDDDGTRVLNERFLEGFAAIEVEMVCRFVEQEKVGRTKENFGECEFVLFAAGENGNGFVDVLVCKQEGAQGSANLCDGDIARKIGARFFEERAIKVECVNLVLGKMREFDAVAQYAFAFKVDAVGEYFDECRFSGAVGCDEGKLVAAIDAEIQVVINDIVTVCF